MISYSRPNYIAELKTMWREIFGDSERYLDSFFDKIYQDDNTLVFIENEKVVSVLYMIPYTIQINKNKEPIVYLYALATNPANRGQKIMSKLIQKSLEISIERGYVFSVLIPAEESLFDYYSQFGYEKCFQQVKITRSIAQIQAEIGQNQKPLTFHRADASQIWRAYSNSIFCNEECVLLTEEQNAFYFKELEEEGGQAFLFEKLQEIEKTDEIVKTQEIEKTDMSKTDDFNAQFMGYALLNLTGDNLQIFETNVSKDQLPSFYVSLMQIFEFKTITFYQPVCFSEEDTANASKPFAMAKALSGICLKEPFINRVLM